MKIKKNNLQPVSLSLSADSSPAGHSAVRPFRQACVANAEDGPDRAAAVHPGR